MDQSPNEFLLLTWLLLVPFSIWIYARRRERQREAQRRVERVHVASPDPRFALDHATAVVVMQRNSGSAGAGESAVESFRILRNPYGEYFLHWCYLPSQGKDDGSYVEHLTRERAMHALRADPAAFESEFGTAMRWAPGRRNAGVSRPPR